MKLDEGWTLVIALGEALVIAVIVYFVAKALLKSLGDVTKPSAPLVTAMAILGIIGVIAVLGGLFTEHESAYTIGAAVAGGLTGYVAAQAQRDRDTANIESFAPEPFNEASDVQGSLEYPLPNPTPEDLAYETDVDMTEDTSGFPKDDDDG